MQILGPVVKEKVIEFLENGTLHEEDELCSGNGYWFWVKENNLIASFIKGDVPQPFNPLNEAENKELVATNDEAPEELNDENGQKLPNEDDLEFPKMD